MSFNYTYGVTIQVTPVLQEDSLRALRAFVVKAEPEFTPKTPGRKGLPKEAGNSALLASERQLRGVSGKLPIMKEGPKWANPTVCRFRLFKYPGGRERMRMR